MQNQKIKFPLQLQFFAGEGEGAGDGEDTQQQQVQTPQFDYQKLADLITGKQSVTEDTVLKSYFKQQGLSQEEMNQAITSFKQQKAANQPDVGVLQTQAKEAQRQAQQAVIERDAYLLSAELGVDLKTMPYLLKMADLAEVVGEDGKVVQDKLKEALNKVLEALPQLKQQQQQVQSGFKIGAAGGEQTQSSVDEQLDRIFGIKKK